MGGAWYSEEQLGWMGDQLEKYMDAQKHKGDAAVSKMHLSLQGEFFSIWTKPSDEGKGTYRQPKRVRKNHTRKPRRVYDDSERDEWVLDRRMQLTDWFNNAARGKRLSQPKVQISVGSSLKRVPCEAQIYTKLYGDKLQYPIQEEMATKDRQYISVLNKVARKKLDGESEEVKAAVAAERDRLQAEYKAARRIEKEMEMEKPGNEYSNAERQAAINALPDTMRLFAAEMGPRTGWTFMIVAGGPNPEDPNGEIETIAYHYGATPTGSTFGQMNGTAVNMILEEFSTFNHLVTPYEERIFRALNPSLKSLEARERFIKERGSAPVVRNTEVPEARDEDGEINTNVLTVRKSKKDKKKEKKKGNGTKQTGSSNEKGGRDESGGSVENDEIAPKGAATTTPNLPGPGPSSESPPSTQGPTNYPSEDPNSSTLLPNTPANTPPPLDSSPTNGDATNLLQDFQIMDLEGLTPVGQMSTIPDSAHEMYTGVEYDLGAAGALSYESGGHGLDDDDDDDRFGGMKLPPYTDPTAEEEDIDVLFDQEGLLFQQRASLLPTYANPLLEGVVIVGVDSPDKGIEGDEGAVGGEKGEIEGEIEGGVGGEGKNGDGVSAGSVGDRDGVGAGSVGDPQPKVGDKRKRGVGNAAAGEEPGKRTRGRKAVSQDMPVWFEEDVAYLKRNIENDDWLSCLQAYEEFEKRAQALGMKARRLGAVKFRPAELTKWLTQRKHQATPEIDDVASFANRWLDWWKEMQPHCRRFSFENQLPGQVKPQFDLADLKSPGKAGLVTVLIGLKWWAGTDAQGVGWAAAVRDVRDCLVHLNRK